VATHIVSPRSLPFQRDRVVKRNRDFCSYVAVHCFSEDKGPPFALLITMVSLLASWLIAQAPQRNMPKTMPARTPD
jgi:hypothetical protein